MSPKVRSLLMLKTAVLLWGGTAMFAKAIPLPVTHIIGIRSLIAAAALFAFLKWKHEPIRVLRPSHHLIMGALGLLLCGHWLTFFQSLKISTAAIAILSLHTYPVLTALVEPLLFGEKLRRSDLLMVLIMFTGIVVMTPQFNLSNQMSQGVLLGILSGLFFMSRNLMTRAFIQSYSGSALMFLQSLYTGLALLPMLWLDAAAEPVSSRSIYLLLLLGVAFTALPQTLYSASLRHLSARTGGILASLLPLYGALFGYLIHDEEVNVRTIAGGALILLCVVVEFVRHSGAERGTADAAT